ncbi:MAG TPA: histidine--tRNA ligase [Patescibacteria group bacterium]|nr:histidine--tRNA ligase [Patescibacteria group bacterium]
MNTKQKKNKKEIRRKFVPKKSGAPAKSNEKKEEEKNAGALKGNKKKTFEQLRGMKDILPRDEHWWKKMYFTAWDLAEAYGFGYLETPLLEDANLFIRSIGKGTDVVDKEMYVFEDRDGSRVALRPEFTAGAVRAYLTHGLFNQPQPVKLWSIGPLFRHDRPQAGRYREFRQFNCESYGVHDPVVEAELIGVAYNFLHDLGIDSTIHINSLGTTEDRQHYLVELVGYLRSKRGYLCEDCKKRITKNPLRVLDCKNESCRPVIEEAPQIIDWLSEDSKNYFMKVLEYLDAMSVPYSLKSTLVRGLDYYTETVFEIYEDNQEEGQQSALGGGGRYDNLVTELGGQPTPACGFGLGLERVVNSLRHRAETSGEKTANQETAIFFAQLGEQARKQGLRLIEELRRSGVKVAHNLGKTALKAQLEMADKIKAKYTLIIGQKEVQDGTIIIRDMESGIQEIVDQKKLKSVLLKRLESVKE